MNFESRIKALTDQYLADARAPDIVGLVDQLFHVAAETGAVACVLEGDKRLRFTGPKSPSEAGPPVSTATRRQATCHIEHPAARTVLRMICARLAAICKDHAATDTSPYGGKALVEYEMDDHRQWSVSFTNTPEQQEFLIEAL